jgi:hypothetical protein
LQNAVIDAPAKFLGRAILVAHAFVHRIRGYDDSEFWRILCDEFWDQDTKS